MSLKLSEMQILKDTEIEMRLKNVFVTFLPWVGSLQWMVHENKALYSYPGRIKSQRYIPGLLKGSLARGPNR